MKNETRDALLRIWCKGVVQFDDLEALADAGELDIVGVVADYSTLGRYEVKCLVAEGKIKPDLVANALQPRRSVEDVAIELLRHGSPEVKSL